MMDSDGNFEVGDEVTFPALPDLPDSEIRDFDVPGCVTLVGVDGTYRTRSLRMLAHCAQLIEPEHPTPAPRSNLLWIGVDLDGTIAQPVWTPENPTHEIGMPIEHNVKKLREAVVAGYKPVIHTSRPWTDYETVEAWLNFYNIPWKQIQMGKPLFALYIDDRGRHSEAESWLPEAAQSGVPTKEEA